MRCDACKFWTPPVTQFEGTVWAVLGKCESAIPLWNATETDDDYNGVFTAEGRGKGAFVQDGSGYHAELLCRPDFGCMDFVPKDAP